MTTDLLHICNYFAYAVSVHKAQGLEYDSVKVIITKEVDEMITHNIFYTAITRSKQHLKIYWSPESQEKILSSFEAMDAKRDASIFAAQSQMKMRKIIVWEILLKLEVVHGGKSEHRV